MSNNKKAAVKTQVAMVAKWQHPYRLVTAVRQTAVAAQQSHLIHVSEDKNAVFITV